MSKTLIYLASIAPLALASMSEAAVLTVHGGERIQDAVQKARPGDTIRVLPGLYEETVYVDRDGIALVGVIEKGRWPVLEGANVRNDGILVAGSDSVVKNFWIQNYKGNGIMHQGSNNWEVRHNVVRDTGVYGIFPQHCRNGIIEDNVVSGIEDAAIYVGMCENVDVRRNETYASVAGIEIENSRHVLVEENAAHGNVGGILAFVLPGLPVKLGSDIILRRNFVFDNNAENWAAVGSVVSGIPGGTGMLLMAVDDVVVEDNILRNNDSAAIMVVDLDLLEPGAPDPGIDPVPDRVRILQNLYAGNGKAPQASAKRMLAALGRERGADVLVGGKSRDGCILERESLVEVGTESFSACPAAAGEERVATMMLPKRIPSRQLSPERKGELVYNSVCAGCHGYGYRLIGPPVKAIQLIYAGNPEGIAAFAANPRKLRPEFPPMPPQDYLPPEVLQAAARHMLEVKD